MKRTTPTLILLAAMAVLSACSPKPAEEATAPAPAPAMAMPPSAPAPTALDTNVASGVGTVTAVDATAGTVTLDHQPIPAIEWLAMTMAFKASPEIVAKVKKGDKVTSDMKLVDGSGEITSIHKQ